jgi:hypothetical protein
MATSNVQDDFGSADLFLQQEIDALVSEKSMPVTWV